MQIATDAAFILPDDFANAALMGRVWRPDLAGPAVVAIRENGVFDISDEFPTASQLAASDPAEALRATKGERIGDAAGYLEQHAARHARSDQTVAAGADRPAGDQGGRRHLRHLDAGAGDRGAGARQSGFGGGHPGRGDADRRHRPVATEAGLGRSAAGQGRADFAECLEPVSRSRHRAGRGGVHQGAGAVGGRHLRGCGPASEIDLEQSGAGGGAGGDARRPASSARRSATTSICATSRDARRCCCPRPRTTTPPAPSGRSCGSSTKTSRSTTSGRWRSRWK